MLKLMKEIRWGRWVNEILQHAIKKKSKIIISRETD